MVQVGELRASQEEQARLERDKAQHHLLTCNRIVESLDLSDANTVFRSDTPLLSCLNWIALLLETETPNPHDIAVGLSESAEHGHITVYLSKANADPPTSAERERVDIIMQTLRASFKNDASKKDSASRFTEMMAKWTLPEMFRKLSVVGLTGRRSRTEVSDYFIDTVRRWVRKHSADRKGETSSSLVELARRLEGPVNGHLFATHILVEVMIGFILHEQIKPLEKISAAQRPEFTKYLLDFSRYLMKSTFFTDFRKRDVRTSDHEENVFLGDLYRRIDDIARYADGLSHFVTFGMPYLTKVLGNEGMEQFLLGTGGIVVRWVGPTQPRTPQVLYWEQSPNWLVREFLTGSELVGMTDETEMTGSEELGETGVTEEELDKMAQTDEVTRLWTQGSPVVPILHAETQLIDYLGRHKLSILDQTIGMNRPPCYLCNAYMANHRQGWKMSKYMKDQPRGPWQIPSECSSKRLLAVQQRIMDRAAEVVEVYAYSCWDSEEDC